MAKRATATVWVGRALSALVGALFLMSGVMKLVARDEVRKGMADMGLPESLALPIAVIELACAVIYLVPATAMLGAILLTGYLGGAILAHLRIGDAVYTHVAIGIAVWLAIALRDSRLWRLIPIRRSDEPVRRTANE